MAHAPCRLTRPDPRLRRLGGEIYGWTVQLRERLATGELASLAPFDLGDGTEWLPGERTVRTMLADVDHFGLLPSGLLETWPYVLRWYELLGDFRRLRAPIG
jgi:hypothetical protein